MLWFKKQSKPEIDVTALAKLLDDIQDRLDALESVPRLPIKAPDVVAQWLPVLDRFQEMALVAQGHPDLAQQFGLLSRQRAAEPTTVTEWETPNDPEPDGMVYG